MVRHDHADETALERLLVGLITRVARLVPAPDRDGWLREWRAELAHALRGRRASRARVAVRSLYSVVDALWIRWEGITMAGWFGTLRQAARSLRRSPAYTLVVLLTVGAGVGATAAIFSLADWALYRPIPHVDDPGAVVALTPRPDGEGIALLSHPSVERLLEGAPGVASVAAYTPVPLDAALAESRAPIRVPGQLVTPSFFGTLGVDAWRGRVFRPEEGDASRIHAVAVVSHRFWRDVLEEDPAIPGRTIVLNGATFEVVGVAPPGFEGPERTSSVSVWVPASAASAVLTRMPANLLTLERAPVWVQIVVRRSGAIPTAAVATALQQAAPGLGESGVRLEPSRRFGLPTWLEARVSDAVGVVAALVAVLLLLTAANLVNLVLSRLGGRRQEAAVRKALGASRIRLTMELAAEALVLATVGAGVAFAIAWSLLYVMDGVQLISTAPELPALVPDVRTLLFAFVTAVGAMAVAILLAGSSLNRGSARDGLTGYGTAHRPRSLQRSMVVLQIGLSLALVVGAGLLVRSLASRDGAELGYQPGGVIAFSLSPGVQGYADDRSDELFREVLDQLHELPEVRSAGFTWLAPIGGRRYTEEAVPLGGADDGTPITAQANMVSPGYLEALGVELLAGRGFDEREYAESLRPDRGDVVLNRSAVAALFPETRSMDDAVGREIRMTGRREAAFRIVGVVEDARLTAVQEPQGPYLYDPFGNGYRTTEATFVARTTGDPETAVARAREIVTELAPGVPLLEAGTLDARISATLTETRTMARIIGIFAVLSLILAGTGLFGLIAESVQARVREFGIRTALGARSAQVLFLVLRESLALAVAGAILGLLVATGVALLLRSYLFGVAALDHATYLAATSLLVLTAVAASLGPALRATRLDPVRAIRSE